MVLIDAHTHLAHEASKFYPHLYLPPEKLLEEMDKNNVDMAVALPNPKPEHRILEVARETNNYIAETVKRYPRLIGFCITTPFSGEDMGAKELERSVRELGLKGVKLHSNMCSFPLNLGFISPIFECASKLRIPVFMHAGHWGCEAERIGFVAERFPEVTVIMAHMGHPWANLNAIEVAKYAKNIVLETSSCQRWAVKGAVDEVGFDRVVWGSDVPYLTVELELRKLQLAGLTKEEFEAVSWKNMARILGLKIRS